MVPNSAATEETLMDVVLDAGAEDINETEDGFEITTPVEDFEAVKAALQQADISWDVAQITKIPSTDVALDEKDARRLLSLMDALEDHDDVQNTYSNFTLPEGMEIEDDQ